MPEISKCVICGKNEKTQVKLNYFSIKDSGLKCQECKKLDKGTIEVSESTSTAIKYIVMSPPKKLFSFNISEENIKELEIISKIYLEDKLDKEYRLDSLY